MKSFNVFNTSSKLESLHLKTVLKRSNQKTIGRDSETAQWGSALKVPAVPAWWPSSASGTHAKVEWRTDVIIYPLSSTRVSRHVNTQY